MVTYTLAALPTVYRGRRYRSRLEARWAAFFDLLGWPYEYEPFDLGSWSPDFLLKGATQVLVEVKPIDSLDDDTCAKMLASAKQAGSKNDLLLLGNSPLDLLGCRECWSYSRIKGTWLNGTWLGYISEGIYFEDCQCILAPGGRIDFCATSGSWHGRMTGVYRGGKDFLVHHDQTNARDLWTEAANRVQWRGERWMAV